MHLFSVKLPIIKKKVQLPDLIIDTLRSNDISLQNRDIIVISEKIVATSQGRIINLSKVDKISDKARRLSKKYDMDERLVELILREANLILGGMTHVILAKVGNFLIANAGIDQSNAGIGNVVLLPKNIERIVWDFWKIFKETYNLDKLGVIIADSRVQPLRKGTIGLAIATAGFEPIEDMRGQPDLFGRPLAITMRAIADDLASAAQFLLNEGNQQTPVVIIRGANVQFTEDPKSTPEMPAEECLYMNIFSKYLLKKRKDLKNN